MPSAEYPSSLPTTMRNGAAPACGGAASIVTKAKAAARAVASIGLRVFIIPSLSAARLRTARASASLLDVAEPLVDHVAQRLAVDEAAQVVTEKLQRAPEVVRRVAGDVRR